MNWTTANKTSIYLLNFIAGRSFRTIYVLADILYFVLYKILGYRRYTIMNNLRNSFPRKDKEELRHIAQRFYRHLSDIILETIKMKGMNNHEFRKRFVVKNPEVLNKFYEAGKNVVVLGMHYNNWEWSSSIALSVKHRAVGVYKPLHNITFDLYMNKNRSKTGTVLIPNSHVLRYMADAQQKQQPVCIWLAADQTPPFFYRYWMTFMNQETLFYPGASILPRKFDCPVYFQRITKISRGFYETEFELLTDSPREINGNDLMKMYIEKMENTIKANPEYYLWSHKRWKHKRPADAPMQN